MIKHGVVFENRVQASLHIVQAISTKNMWNEVSNSRAFLGPIGEINEENYKWELDKNNGIFMRLYLHHYIDYIHVCIDIIITLIH